MIRNWHIEGLAVRPDHRMIGHTGFLLTARRLADGVEPPCAAAAPPRAPTATTTPAPTPMAATAADASTHDHRGRVPAAHRELGHIASRLTPQQHQYGQRPPHTPPFPRTVTCGTMRDTPPVQPSTGDTPSAALRRPGTGTHAHPPHPLARHGHRPRRSRRPLLGPPAGLRHRGPGSRPRGKTRRSRRTPTPPASTFPSSAAPSRSSSRKRQPETSTATADPKRSSPYAATPAPAPRPTACTSSPRPPTPSTPRRRDPRRPQGPPHRHRPHRQCRRRHGHTPRLLVPRRPQMLPGRRRARQVAVEERRVPPLDTRRRTERVNTPRPTARRPRNVRTANTG